MRPAGGHQNSAVGQASRVGVVRFAAAFKVWKATPSSPLRWEALPPIPTAGDTPDSDDAAANLKWLPLAFARAVDYIFWEDTAFTEISAL
jgi:hypothetical protein